MYFTYHMYCDEELLYVGKTKSFSGRLNQHRSSSKWFSRVNRIELFLHKDEQEMCAIEKREIGTRKPPNNIFLNPDNKVYVAPKRGMFCFG